MGSFSDYAELKILDHVLGGPDFSRPATVYIALCTAAPTDASTGSTIVEANYTGYARKSVTNNDTNFPAAAAGSKSNGVAIEFAKCTALTSTVTHFAICDQAAAGNVIGWGQLSAPKVIEADDIPRFGVGDFVLTQD